MPKLFSAKLGESSMVQTTGVATSVYVLHFCHAGGVKNHSHEEPGTSSPQRDFRLGFYRHVRAPSGGNEGEFE
jgi:hypothetical protein